MKITRSHLSVTALFLAGIILGGVATHFWMVRQFEHMRRASPQERANMIMHRISENLHLTPQQEQQLSPLVLDMEDKLADLRSENQSKMEAVAQDEMAKANAFLDADQKRALQELYDRAKEHFDRRHGLREPAP